MGREGGGEGERRPPPRKKESHPHGLSAIVIAGVDIELDCRDCGVDLSDHYRGPSIRVAFLFAGGCGFAWCWGGLVGGVESRGRHKQWKDESYLAKMHARNDGAYKHAHWVPATCNQKYRKGKEIMKQDSYTNHNHVPNTLSSFLFLLLLQVPKQVVNTVRKKSEASLAS